MFDAGSLHEFRARQAADKSVAKRKGQSLGRQQMARWLVPALARIPAANALR